MPMGLLGSFTTGPERRHRNGGFNLGMNTMVSGNDQQDERPIATFRIGGVRVHAASFDAAVGEVLGWCQTRQQHYVCVRDAHGIVRAQTDEDLMTAHEAAGLVVTDGMPLVWLARALGLSAERVVGRDLMLAICDQGQTLGLRHYFYGGAPGVAEALAAELQNRFPGLIVAGAYCPPFRELTADEDASICAEINDSGADVVWVGLSTPKQEYWMAAHQGRIRAAAMLGVGAAFDYLTGNAAPAPGWMQRAGLEWIYRVWQDPARLLQRYLWVVPQFGLIVTKDVLRGRNKSP